MPLGQAQKYATQIADALDRAHRSGVSHRDVKPANIMLTRDGVKVLDFGLAKTAPKTAGPDDATLTAALTGEGTVLGTPQYMAPEQYEGKEADARSDIFAFGCVTYEMVTGKRCFDGKTKASVIAAVLGADPPPMSAAQPLAPPALERLVKRCLEKDPEDRYQSMRDVVLDLRAVRVDGTGGVRAEVSVRPTLAWIVAGVLAALAAGLAFVHFRETPPAGPVSLGIVLPPGQSIEVSDMAPLAISADGKRVVYTGSGPNGAQLYVRELSSFRMTSIPGTQGAVNPFFSPDGQWVAFTAAG